MFKNYRQNFLFLHFTFWSFINIIFILTFSSPRLKPRTTLQGLSKIFFSFFFFYHPPLPFQWREKSFLRHFKGVKHSHPAKREKKCSRLQFIFLKRFLFLEKRQKTLNRIGMLRGPREHAHQEAA